MILIGPGQKRSGENKTKNPLARGKKTKKSDLDSDGLVMRIELVGGKKESG